MSVYITALVSVFAIIVLMNIQHIWRQNQGLEKRAINDFDAFYLVGALARAGRIGDAYAWSTLFPLQEEVFHAKSFMPWTYPPQFDLIVHSLAPFPIEVAYAIFCGVTLLAYLCVLRVLAGPHLLTATILLCPAVTVTIVCGQNGLLTGALTGLACLSLMKGRDQAGIPLGLMIIKPHLAVGYGLHTLVNRRIGVTAWAAATILSTSALATAMYGPEIWIAVLHGAAEAKVFLAHGAYPLFRMISVYAMLRSLQVPAGIAFEGQILTACLVLGLACWPNRQRTQRQALGLVGMASVLVSPYAYDYDLPVYGVGLALLLPDILRCCRPVERLGLYGLTWLGGIWGLALSMLVAHRADFPWVHVSEKPATLAPAALLIAFLVAVRGVTRANAMDDAGSPLAGRTGSGGICSAVAAITRNLSIRSVVLARSAQSRLQASRQARRTVSPKYPGGGGPPRT